MGVRSLISNASNSQRYKEVVRAYPQLSLCVTMLCMEHMGRNRDCYLLRHGDIGAVGLLVVVALLMSMFGRMHVAVVLGRQQSSSALTSFMMLMVAIFKGTRTWRGLRSAFYGAQLWALQHSLWLWATIHMAAG